MTKAIVIAIDETKRSLDPLALVAPCTTTIRELDSEVRLEPGGDPVPRPSAVNLDSIESVSTGGLVERPGQLADQRMQDVCGALAVAVDCQA